MVKADVKHNYYADLELSSTCTIDEVKKQFRRLALVYHPDRNAGREAEVVPKFQAIQTAHEILSDPVQKSKYDTDRRKAGLYPQPSFRTAQQTQPTGQPYAATSAYPPPPRRTQPGTWQPPPRPTATAPNGADKFASFARGAPTARKDPTADRSSNFTAWQNLNAAQQRQQQQQQRAQQTSQAPPMPSPNRPRPPPRNDTKMPSEEEIRAGMNYRNATGGGATFAPNPNEPLSQRRTAWQAFQQNQARSGDVPGVGRSNTTRTPKKATGFDPNAPGSDERPAGDGAYTHSHRHRSEDFGRMPPGSFPPPPPPGPPPSNGAIPGTSPTAARSDAPYTEGGRKRMPYNGFNGEKTQFGRNASYEAEGLRRTASTRDTTKLSPNGGSANRARSTSPLGRNHGHTQGHEHAPSNGSAGESAQKKNGGFVNYSDSDITDNGQSDSEDSDIDSNAAETGATPLRPGTAPQSRTPFERPMKVPTPPSRLFHGDNRPPRPQTDGAAARSDNDGAQPGMQQKKNGNNMYVSPSAEREPGDFFSHQRFGDDVSFNVGGDEPSFASSSDSMFAPFESKIWRARMFSGVTGDTSTLGKGRKVPAWAVPSSVTPGGAKRADSRRTSGTPDISSTNATPGASPHDPSKTQQSPGPVFLADQQLAALRFVRHELEHRLGEVPGGLDMDVFLSLASTAHYGQRSGNMMMDSVVQRALHLFPYVGLHLPPPPKSSQHDAASGNAKRSEFTFPFNAEAFTAKSRSAEHINTKFTPEGWSGQFGGGEAAKDYFSPPAGQGMHARRERGRESPGRRGGKGGRSGRGTPTATPHAEGVNGHHNSAAPNTPAAGHTTAAGGEKSAPEFHAGEVKFSKEQWEKTFADASWSYPPPPPPNVPASLSGRGGRAGMRKGSSKGVGGRAATAATGAATGPGPGDGSKEQPHVVEDDGGANKDFGEDVDEDAMDIDSSPPAMHKEDKSAGAAPTPTHDASAKEPRMYAVPSSSWHQARQQPNQANGHRRPSTIPADEDDGKFKTNLDDLAHVEPLAPSTNAAGLGSMADVKSTLPFASQASSTLPTSDEPLPGLGLQLPTVPKAPEPPARLTKQSWHAFAGHFGAYLQAHHTFNRSMVQHFATREGQAQGQLSAGLNWLEAAGDGVGFGSYMQGVKEDERARELWGLGCDRHAEAVKGFEAVRERVRKLGAAGGLVDQ